MFAASKRVSLFRRSLGLGALAVTLTASADQLENKTASDCVATVGAATVRADGGLENASASTVTVVCPVERRSPGGAFTTYLAGRVWAVDRHASSGVCCRVVSVNPGNGAVVESAPVCTAGSAASAQSIDLPEINDPYSYSHFMVRCDLPPTASGLRSRIQTVRNIQH
jgi:hypothetical protein